LPFTLSHPAAAAPLWPLIRRLRVPLAAVAIGAMSPDFEYFIHLRTLALWSHSLTGLFVFCLPAGLIVLALWELFAREPVLDLLGLGEAFHSTSRDRWWWGRAAAGLVIGAATHVLWDSFTHDGKWGVRQLPMLRATAGSVGGLPLPWFIVLDHVSTVIGGLVVLGWLGQRMSRAGAFRAIAHSRWRWTTLLALAIAAVAVGLWNGFREPAALDYWNGEVWLARAMVGALLGLGLAILGFSFAYVSASGRRAR
jgi:hypothetical protein